MAQIEALGSGTDTVARRRATKPPCRTSQDFQIMEIRERLGVRIGHAHIEKGGSDSHEHPVQDEA